MNSKLTDYVVIPAGMEKLMVFEASASQYHTQWEHDCNAQLTMQFVREIKSQLALLNLEMDDCCVWTASIDGRFSTKSAWDLCRMKCSSLGLSKMMQHPSVTLKWQFLTWKAVKGGILDCCIQKKGISLASKWNCCSVPARESVDHVFVNSVMAKDVTHRPQLRGDK